MHAEAHRMQLEAERRIQVELNRTHLDSLVAERHRQVEELRKPAVDVQVEELHMQEGDNHNPEGTLEAAHIQAVAFHN